MNHDKIEKNVGWLITLTLIAVSIGGMVEIFPMVFDRGSSKPIETLEPYTAVQLEGRDIYIREGCTVCHTQMVRTLQFETARYGHYSVAGEDVYEHPFLWGSKRTASNMPAYPWLFERELDGKGTADKMRTLRTLGVPYTDADIAGAGAAVAGTIEAEALIAYLQSLGLNMRDYAGGAR
jgi:cytochrome c oxidase cbb3-type subunit 2